MDKTMQDELKKLSALFAEYFKLEKQYYAATYWAAYNKYLRPESFLSFRKKYLNKQNEIECFMIYLVETYGDEFEEALEKIIFVEG